MTEGGGGKKYIVHGRKKMFYYFCVLDLAIVFLLSWEFHRCSTPLNFLHVFLCESDFDNATRMYVVGIPIFTLLVFACVFLMIPSFQN